MESLLLHRCKIQTRSASTNDFGEKRYTWADTYTGVPCRFAQSQNSMGGMMQRLNAGEFVSKLPKIFLKNTQTIVEQNRIVGTTGFENTYDVEKIKKAYDSVGIHHIECELKKVV